jgi:hypothetical protein
MAVLPLVGGTAPACAHMAVGVATCSFKHRAQIERGGEGSAVLVAVADMRRRGSRVTMDVQYSTSQ